MKQEVTRHCYFVVNLNVNGDTTGLKYVKGYLEALLENKCITDKDFFTYSVKPITEYFTYEYKNE